MIRHAAAVAVALCLSPSWLHAQPAQTLQLTVNAASANVHKSPSTGSPVLGKARRGAALEVLRELGDWVKIVWPETEDGFGYVHLNMGSLTRGTTPRPRNVGAPAPRPASQYGTPAATDPHIETVVAGQRTHLGTIYIPPPTHLVGLGGRMSGSTLGFGVTGRAWSRNRLGVQVDVSRIAQTSIVVPGRVTSLQFAPSFLYSIGDRVTDYVWLRPYVGAGARIHRHTLSSVTPEASVSQNKFGFQAFGGAELTLASVSRFALSIDAGYDWSKTPFDGFDVGGLGFAVSGHWYFK